MLNICCTWYVLPPSVRDSSIHCKDKMDEFWSFVLGRIWKFQFLENKCSNWNSKKIQLGSANINVVKGAAQSPWSNFWHNWQLKQRRLSDLSISLYLEQSSPIHVDRVCGQYWFIGVVSPGPQLWSTALPVPSPLTTTKLCLLIPCYSCNHRSSSWAAQTGLGGRVDAWAVCPCNLHTPVLWPGGRTAQASFSLCCQVLLPAVISSSWRTICGFSFGKLWTNFTSSKVVTIFRT